MFIYACFIGTLKLKIKGIREGAMAALQSLSYLYGVNSHRLSKEENFIIEAGLFVRLCEELHEFIKKQYREYFTLIKINPRKENAMIETNFLRCIVNDILSTGEYTLSGIAYYSHVSEDVIYEIISGCNTNPSLLLARKIIDLHRSIRKDLYQAIFKKITLENSAVA